ncbi:reverse transcriptase domain-containing protein [Tanacetum coccineum]|uniref:Reverse transcriptase domain-containing protein n=1 Tax=Tanacetum coccineum TaxID=301880 RepID=A0ABQ5EYK9_9ASTR
MVGQVLPQGLIPDLRPMEELLQAPTDVVGDAIVVPPVLANQFELKIARAWLEKEPPNSSTTWNDLVSKFVNRFFPPSKTTNLQNEITKFQQRFGETFAEAWDRFKDLLNKSGALQERPQGVFAEHTTVHPREDLKAITTRSDVTLAGPLVPPPPLSSSSEVEREPETTTDQVLTESTTSIPPLVVQPSPASTSFELPPAPISSPVIPEPNQHQPLIPYPSRLNKEKLQDKADIQIHSFLQMFKKMYFNTIFAKALAHMPKFAKMAKDLLTNKEKLIEMANNPLNENCSDVLLKKLPEVLRDTRRFLIPCDFYGFESCMALADLGASINLMPLYVWKKLSLPELSPTRMTLELATRTVAYPAGIAEDVFVQVGKFTFPTDFVVVDYDVDPRVPLISGRPFLRTAHALVDVHGEELTLRVGYEKLVFNVESTSKYPRKHGDESIHKIGILDITCEDHFHEVLNVQKLINPMSGSLTPSPDPVITSLSHSLTPFGDSDFILEEIDTFLASDDSTSSDDDDGAFDIEGDIRLIETLLNNDISNDLPPPLLMCVINETEKIKSSIDDVRIMKIHVKDSVTPCYI